MKTQVPAPTGSSERAEAAGAARGGGRGRGRAAFGGAAALLVVVVVVIPFFASTYAVHHFVAPLGWDTPKYLWKASLASHLGVTSLPARLPPPVNGSPDRPAFAVVALTAGRALGLDAVRVAEALPFAMAAAIGLACAGLASIAFDARRWEAAVVGSSVGASAWVARMAGPETYQDNLMVAAIVVAVAALGVAAAARGRGFLGPALLLGAAALVHWPFAVLFAAILAGAALLLAPGSVRQWRRGDAPLFRTPSAGLAAVAAGGALAGVAALYGALGAELRAPKTSPQARAEYGKKIRHDLAGYAPWLTVPGAAIGSASLAVDRRGSRRTGRRRVAWAVLIAWLAVTAVAALVAVAGATVPTHRFLAFALPVPFLMAAGAVALPRVLGDRWDRAGRATGMAVAAVLLAGGFVTAQALWSGVAPQSNAVLGAEAADAARYLDRAHVPAGTPVVFIANSTRNPGVDVALMAHQIRAALPPGRIDHAFVYLGDPAGYMAGHPTILRPVTGDVAGYDGTSWRYFRSVRPLLRHGPTPVALLLSAANPDHGYLDRWAAGHPMGPPGVWVVAGPPAPVAAHAVPSTADLPRVPAGAVGWSAFALLMVVWVVGSGWAVAAGPPRGRWFGAAALAPAVGVALVVTAGVVADRAGIRLASGGGIATLAVAAIAGWAVAAASGRLRRGPGDAPAFADPPVPVGELRR
ncbi:MAG TPA: hypothetical protein VID47_18300 [Actinomycetota bacterium]